MRSIIAIFLCLIIAPGAWAGFPFAFWLSSAAPPPSPPAVVAHTAAALGGNGGTTSAIDTTGANFVVLSVGFYNGFGPTTPSDSKGNTYTALTEVDATGSVGHILYYCFAPTVGSGHTFTYARGSIFASIEVIAFSGVGSSFDQQNGNTSAASATVTTGSITPGQANTLVIAGLAFSDSSTAVSATLSGYTVQDFVAGASADRVGSAIGYLVLSSATAQNPTWTLSAIAAGNAAKIASFKYP